MAQAMMVRAPELTGTYGGLVDAIERRRIELNLTQADVDTKAGFAPGTYAKIAAWRTDTVINLLNPQRIGPVLKALSLRVAFVPVGDPERGQRCLSMVRSKRKAA